MNNKIETGWVFKNPMHSYNCTTVAISVHFIPDICTTFT